MASGIEYLLTQCVRKPEDDLQWGLGWWTLDAESLHNDLLQVLLSGSQEFAAALLSAGGRCYRPSRDFDLAVDMTTNQKALIEIKVWSGWSATQRDKQVALLRQAAPSKGFVVLLAKSSAQSRQQVADLTQENFTKISYSDLYRALDAARGDTGLCEMAAAYKVGLQQQESRLRKQYSWNPND